MFYTFRYPDAQADAGEAYIVVQAHHLDKAMEVADTYLKGINRSELSAHMELRRACRPTDGVLFSNVETR